MVVQLLYTEHYHHEQDVVQDQFLSGVQLFWIQFSFS